MNRATSGPGGGAPAEEERLGELMEQRRDRLLMRVERARREAAHQYVNAEHAARAGRGDCVAEHLHAVRIALQHIIEEINDDR